MEDEVFVPITQYHPPRGKKTMGGMLLPKEIAELVEKYKFLLSVEILRDGTVVTYCQYGEKDGQEDLSPTPNGPEVREGLVEMIKRCADKKKEQPNG